MQVKTEQGIKDVAIMEVTPETFIVPKGEEQFYHCRIEVRRFNASTGARISRPRMQCFGKKFFENGGREELERQGYTVEVMHNPAAWCAEQAAIKAEAERVTMEKKRAEEREALKQEIRAEMVQSGEIPASDIPASDIPAPEMADADAPAPKGKPGRKPKEENNK